ncbi:DMT family transporter [Helicobacter muridarum]|nr:DMT family transporter [Helicobacter muridarum]
MIIAMMGWGLVWPLSKLIVEILNPEQASCIRFIIVSISFMPIMIYLRIPFKIPKISIIPICLMGIFTAIYNYLMYIGLQYGDAGSAGVMTEVLPVIIATFIWSLIRKSSLLKREKWGLAFGVLSGVFLTNVFANIQNLLTPFNSIYLLAAFCWAILMIISRYATEYISVITLSFYSSLITAISLMPSFFYYGIDGVLESDFRFWISMIVVALFCTTFSTATYYRGLQVLGITQGGVYGLLVPVFALGFSWVLLGEIPQWYTVVGGFIAIFAIYLINYLNPKHFSILEKYLGKFKP